MTELKPCPFCDSTDITIGHSSWDEKFGSHYPYIFCRGCGASVSYIDKRWGLSDSEKDVKEMWNKRVRE